MTQPWVTLSSASVAACRSPSTATPLRRPTRCRSRGVHREREPCICVPEPSGDHRSRHTVQVSCHSACGECEITRTTAEAQLALAFHPSRAKVYAWLDVPRRLIPIGGWHGEDVISETMGAPWGSVRGFGLLPACHSQRQVEEFGRASDRGRHGSMSGVGVRRCHRVSVRSPRRRGSAEGPLPHPRST